jgi:hypothetical protein
LSFWCAVSSCCTFQMWSDIGRSPVEPLRKPGSCPLQAPDAIVGRAARSVARRELLAPFPTADSACELIFVSGQDCLAAGRADRDRRQRRLKLLRGFLEFALRKSRGLS